VEETGGPGENHRVVTDKLDHITEQWRICLWVWRICLWVSFVSLSTIFWLGFRTVMTVWYFLFIDLFHFILRNNISLPHLIPEAL
jgi:hypothetical protein